MGLLQNIFNRFVDLPQVIRQNDGYVPVPFTTILDASPRFNDYLTDVALMNAVLKSPAVMKVFALQCDLFSLAKVYVYDDKGEEVLNDPAIDRLKRPNKLQSQSQFFWDYMFWNMLGTVYFYHDSSIVTNEQTNLFFLDPRKLTFPVELERQQDKFIFSDKTMEEIGKLQATYKYDDGKEIKIPLSNISTITDLSNGMGNWWKGRSRLESLYKVISNSESALDSKNINVRYAGKFMVAGQSDADNIAQLPMNEEEKQDIESKMNGRKQVYATKSMIDIKRFVTNLAQLELGKAYLEDYFLIGSMYGIPREVLEAYQSATYENQEKARGAHVSYCLQPKGDQFMDVISDLYGYREEDKKLVIGWDHLPFMQVFEKDRAEVERKKVETLTNMLKINIPLDECNAFLDTNFKMAEYVATNQNTTNTGTNQGNQGN